MTTALQLDKIKAGMIAASPVINQYGQVLVNVGDVIVEEHKRLLKMWGVGEIDIEAPNPNHTLTLPKDEGNNGDGSINPDIIRYAKKQLEVRLLWEPRNEMESDLVEMGVMRVISQIG